MHLKRLFSLLLISSWLLCGCAQLEALPFWPKPVVAETPTLLIYSALGQNQIDAYLPLFQKAHPEIKVTVERYNTWDLERKVIAEKTAATRADIIWGLAGTAMLRIQAEGVLEPFVTSQGDTLDRINKISTTMRDRSTTPSWIGFDIYVSAICVNTDKMTDLGLPIPRSWKALTDSRYKGLISMPNPNSSGTGFMAMSSWMQLWGEEKAWEYLSNLDKNIVSYTDSGRKPCDNAVKGDVPIGIALDSAGIDVIKKGNPVEVIFPEEGSGWEVEAVAMLRKNQINPLAHEFMAWAISEEAMNAYANFYPLTAIKTSIEIPSVYPSDPYKQLVPNRFVWGTANYDRLTGKWVSLYAAKTESGATSVPSQGK